MSPRRLLGVWLALWLVGASWALATPLMGAPDEPSHAVKAAAVVRGQLGGTPDPDYDGRAAPGQKTLVRVPETFASLDPLPGCYAFSPRQPADCAPPVTGDPDRTAVVGTLSGRYPPLYFALTGWPTLVSPEEPGLYAVRVVSAGLAAALLAWGLHLLLRTPSPRWALLGAAAALPPMVGFLLGTVNPSALEVAAAFCAWCALLPVALQPDPAQLRVRVLTAGGALVLMLGVRASAPVLAALLVLTVAALAPWRLLRDLVRRPVVLAGGALVLLAVVGATAWVVLAGTLAGPTGRWPQYADPAVAAREAAARTPDYLRQMVGVFGWLDAPAPLLTPAVWAVAVGGLLVAALVAGGARARAVLLGVVAVGLVLPVAAQVPQAGDIGLIWQGRYLLPFAVGLPLACALVAARRWPGGPGRAGGVVVAALLLAHGTALHAAVLRATVGAGGDVLLRDPAWQPPGGPWLVQAGAAAGLLAATALLARAASGALGEGLPAAPDDACASTGRPSRVHSSG
jgi:hypothetical protein